MILPEVRQEVRAIRLLARTDPEAAHAREDKLFADVLTFIASGLASKQDAALLAKACLKAKGVKFARWTA